MPHGDKHGSVGRHFARANNSQMPSAEEVNGGIPSLGQNRITAARTVIECPVDIEVGTQGGISGGSNQMLLLAAGLVVVSLLLMRRSAA